MISIVGGGYVGLVSAACFAELGHSVNLIEIDGERVEAINSARPPIYEKGLEGLLEVHAGRSLAKINAPCLKNIGAQPFSQYKKFEKKYVSRLPKHLN
jgi:UDP-glucose 6-dehydrogenase